MEKPFIQEMSTEQRSARYALDRIAGEICSLAGLAKTAERAREMADLAQAGNFLLAYLGK